MPICRSVLLLRPNESVIEIANVTNAKSFTARPRLREPNPDSEAARAQAGLRREGVRDADARMMEHSV